MEDFNAVKATGADLIGLIIIDKDLEGNVSIDVEDHAVRTGAKKLGGVGFDRRPVRAAAARRDGGRRRGRRRRREGRPQQDRGRHQGGGPGRDPDRWRRAHRRLPPGLGRRRRGRRDAEPSSVARARRTGPHKKALEAAMADAQAELNAPA